MSRLRVRIELNRRMSGVPLDKMASVVEETRKFFYLLSQDVHIEADRGEWLASDFDAESLNFTAEYVGPVSPEQVHAFGAAFSGATSLRRTTIAQFTRIAEFLGEDELVGFGLYQSDEEPEPTEWRCLSKRDAMRFGDEIKLLAEAAGEQLSESQLPAVMNGSIAGRRLFKDRRENDRREREALAANPSKAVRELESSLTRRIGLLEGEVAEQTRMMQQLTATPDVTEERFQKLLAAMETFWAQAPRQFPQLPAPAVAMAPPPAPVAEASPAPVPVPESAPTPVTAPIPLSAPVQAEAPVEEPKPAPVPDAEPEMTTPAPETQPAPTLTEVPQKPRRWSVPGVAAAAAAAIVLGLAFPVMQHQWARFNRVETLPMVKPKPPGAPVMPAMSTPQHVEERPVEVEVQHSVKTVAARTPEPFVGPQIPLDIPARLKPKIQSDVQVDVLIAIDREGNVTGASVASTKGDRARLLVTEALRAAKEAHFRPAKEGERTVDSKMILTFLFKPESGEF